MRARLAALVGLALVAGACAAPVSSEIDCPQLAVGERVIVTGSPEQTNSEWGFVLDTVQWTAGDGISVIDWQLGGDLDNDALEAVVQGEAAGIATLGLDYAQLSSEPPGAVRMVDESCIITVIEPPSRDLTGTWSFTRDVEPLSECAGGPIDGTVEVDIAQDSSGNLVVEGINAGYEAWTGVTDGSAVTFGGLRDELAEFGGGTTEATFDLTSTSRTRMNGIETWSWTDGLESCEATSEISARRR